MHWIKELMRRLRMLRRHRQFNDEMDEEMRLHLDLRRQEQLDKGIAPEEASDAARRKFGNATLLREQSRDGWGWTWLEQAAQDLRYAVRAMVRDPGFTMVAVTILALGIGANSAIFSVINAVLLRPLGYQDPDRLVTLLHHGNGPVSAANYLDWRDQSRSFEAMAAAEYWTPNLSGTETPQKVWGLRLTQNLMPMLGVKPLLGRYFLPQEELPGSERVVILGHGNWQRNFGSDRGILGKSILLDGAAHTIVGVMPPEFQFAPFWATRAEIWSPLPLAQRASQRDGNSLRIFARLKPEVSLEQARAEMSSITSRIEQQFPGSNRNVRVTPLKENVVGKVEAPLLIVMGAVAFLLLIACANVAHMLLARAAGRQKEVALRSAIGASDGRLVRQFLAEGLLLSVCAATIGLALTSIAMRALLAIGPASIPRLQSVTLDHNVLWFSLLVALVTGVAFSFAPIVHAKTMELTAVLKESAKAAGGSVRLRRTRSLLAISEVALAFMLLAGAGLLVRSFAFLRSLDPGFNPSNVLSMIVSVAGTPLAQPGAREAFYRQLVDHMAKLPGVESAGAINHLPLAGDQWGWPFDIEDRPAARPGESAMAITRFVMPGYFAAMRLPIVQGRDISTLDDSRAPGVAIINETTAKRYWPSQSPLGKRISLNQSRSASTQWLTIIGVAKDAQQMDWGGRTDPEIYYPALQNREFLTAPRNPYITLVLRVTGDPANFAAKAKNAVWSINRNLVIADVITLDQVIGDETAQSRFEMTLLALFAAVALLIATAGIYALMSFSVSRRVHEIGVRISIGASGREVALSILREGMSHVLAGSVAGGIGALLIARVMGKMLFGVQASDPMTFAIVFGVLNSAALIAIYVPARRAASVDPIIALRHE